MHTCLHLPKQNKYGMFNLNEVREAHKLVKSGADFPKYVQQLIRLGVKKYNTYVSDGRTVFFGEDDYEIQSLPTYAKLTIANISDKERFKHFLKSHQRGQTDYPTFFNNAAATGVEKWTVDMSHMTCTYYNKLNIKMLEEKIPSL
jgi:uncharacterized protein YbcV (DUF1398 family)